MKCEQHGGKSKGRVTKRKYMKLKSSTYINTHMLHPSTFKHWDENVPCIYCVLCIGHKERHTTLLPLLYFDFSKIHPYFLGPASAWVTISSIQITSDSCTLFVLCVWLWCNSKVTFLSSIMVQSEHVERGVCGGLILVFDISSYPYSPHGCHDLHPAVGPGHVKAPHVLSRTFGIRF